MVVFVVRRLLTTPFLSDTQRSRFVLSTFTMLWPKKRNASTDLLRRLQAHMTQHEADFIGGDFNMSAFSAVGDAFADPEFSAPGNSLLWGLGALEDSNRERAHYAQTTV